MEDNERTIIELTDEAGNAVKFEHLCTVEYDDDEYAILSPYTQDGDDEDEQEVVIMRIEPGEEEDEYIGIEDEELLDKVFNIFLDMMDDEEEEDE